MPHVRSADGTTIAYDRTGTGPALILVDGALCFRASGPSKELAQALSDRFTVYRYDRRGRGESTDGTAPHAVAREVEDIAALIEEAGGSAFVCGQSSGAALTMHASASGLPITKAVVFEPPFAVDDDMRAKVTRYRSKLDAALAAGRRGDAVRAFLRLVGLPRPMVALFRFLPMWKTLTSIAHTLPYDLDTLMPGEELTAGRWDAATVPTLVLHGTKTWADLQTAARAVAAVLPDAEHDVLPGQTHMVGAAALAPKVVQFCLAADRASS